MTWEMEVLGEELGQIHAVIRDPVFPNHKKLRYAIRLREEEVFKARAMPWR
jgi:hypothetical protein